VVLESGSAENAPSDFGSWSAPPAANQLFLFEFSRPQNCRLSAGVGIGSVGSAVSPLQGKSL
jgi:hypothetical protein